MALWAQSHSGYDAIHVLSHGDEATITLGKYSLNSNSLTDAGVQAQLATLGDAISANGDLLFYGCYIASGEAGQTFTANLASLSGYCRI